jgi:hypothetical protein
MAKLASRVIIGTIMSIVMGCAMKTFSGQQELMDAALQAFDVVGGFQKIECPPQGERAVQTDYKSIRICFATNLEPIEFVSKLDSELKKIATLYSPWSENYGSTHGSYLTSDEKYQFGINYSPKSTTDYIEEGRVVKLKDYPPMKNAKAYMWIIVENYTK